MIMLLNLMDIDLFCLTFSYLNSRPFHDMWPFAALAQVGEELKHHLDRLPPTSVLRDQGMAFQDLDGGESSDSGLESIL